MSFENILKNPTLKGHVIVRRIQNGGYIEQPDNWLYYTRADNPDITAQSLHIDNGGYKLSWGWLANTRFGYTQKVQVEAGQRYLAKADLVFHYQSTTAQFKTSDLAARWFVEGTQTIYLNQVSPDDSKNKTLMSVFQPAASGEITLRLEVESRFATHTCDLQIAGMWLEKVPADYGTPIFVYPIAVSPPPVPEPPPLTLPEFPILIHPGWKMMRMSAVASAPIPLRHKPLGTSTLVWVQEGVVRVNQAERWGGFVPVMTDSHSGWVSLDAVRFENIVAPPVEPPDASERSQLEARLMEIYINIAAADDLIAEAHRTKARLHGEASKVYDQIAVLKAKAA